MFRFFVRKAKKEDVDQLNQAVQTGFNTVKRDIGSLSKWIKHLNSNNSKIDDDIFELREKLSSLKEDFEDVKNMLNFVGESRVFKQQQTVFNKQTPVLGVLNTVQTGVQTAFLDNLTTNERAIVFVLINSDMKLSYEDLAAMLGKRKSTIRGQVNSIKQKSEGLIEEVVGENNKKRVFIPEKVKGRLLKSRKVRNNKKRKSEE